MMLRIKLVVIVLVLAVVRAGLADGLPEASIIKADVPPAIDGVLNDEAWKSALTITNFIVTWPKNRIGSRLPDDTTVYLLYDNTFLYLAADCRDDQINALLTNLCTKHDGNWGDDCIEIFLALNAKRIGDILGSMNDAQGAQAAYREADDYYAIAQKAAWVNSPESEYIKARQTELAKLLQK